MNYFKTEDLISGIIISILFFVKNEKKFKKYDEEKLHTEQKTLDKCAKKLKKKYDKKYLPESLRCLCYDFQIELFLTVNGDLYNYGEGECIFLKYCKNVLYFNAFPSMFNLPPGINCLKCPCFKTEDILSVLKIPYKKNECFKFKLSSINYFENRYNIHFRIFNKEFGSCWKKHPLYKVNKVSLHYISNNKSDKILYLYHNKNTNLLFLITDWKLFFRGNIKNNRYKNHLHKNSHLNALPQFINK